MLRFLTFCLLLALTGCNNPFSSKEEKPYKVLLLVPNDQGGFSFETKTLETMDDPVTVEGANLKVRINSKFYPSHIEDQVPRASYRVNDEGVLLPADTHSMLYYGLYYNMEQLLKFDSKIGITSSLPTPRVVSIQTDVIKSFSGAVKVWKNNLAYLPDYDRIVVYKFDESFLPAPMNLGLLAHEHFHAIFERIVQPNQLVKLELQREETQKIEAARAQKIQDLGLTPDVLGQMGVQQMSELLKPTEVEKEKLRQEVKAVQAGAKGYNYLMLNALTEGFADYWAWLVTGKELPARDTYTEEDLKSFNIISRQVRSSIVPVYSEYRMKMNFNYATFSAQEMGDAEQIKNKRMVRDYFYEYGAMYSMLLRSMSESIQTAGASEDQKRVEAGRWILQGLQGLQQKLVLFNQTQLEDETLSQDLILENFIPQNLDLAKKTELCSKVQTFLQLQPEMFAKIKTCAGVK